MFEKISTCSGHKTSTLYNSKNTLLVFPYIYSVWIFHQIRCQIRIVPYLVLESISAPLAILKTYRVYPYTIYCSVGVDPIYFKNCMGSAYTLKTFPVQKCRKSSVGFLRYIDQLGVSVVLLLSSLQIHIGYVWMGIQTIPRPLEFYRARTAALGSEIPGSATVLGSVASRTIFEMMYIYRRTGRKLDFGHVKTEYIGYRKNKSQNTTVYVLHNLF